MRELLALSCFVTDIVSSKHICPLFLTSIYLLAWYHNTNFWRSLKEKKESWPQIFSTGCGLASPLGSINPHSIRLNSDIWVSCASKQTRFVQFQFIFSVSCIQTAPLTLCGISSIPLNPAPLPLLPSGALNTFLPCQHTERVGHLDYTSPPGKPPRTHSWEAKSETHIGQQNIYIFFFPGK